MLTASASPTPIPGPSDGDGPSPQGLAVGRAPRRDSADSEEPAPGDGSSPTPDGPPSPTAAPIRCGPDRSSASHSEGGASPGSVDDLPRQRAGGGSQSRSSAATRSASQRMAIGSRPPRCGDPATQATSSCAGTWPSPLQMMSPRCRAHTSLGRRPTSPSSRRMAVSRTPAGVVRSGSHSSRSYWAGAMVSGWVPAAGRRAGWPPARGGRRGGPGSAGRCNPAAATPTIIPGHRDRRRSPAGRSSGRSRHLRSCRVGGWLSSSASQARKCR
jgi:hypothetical protein